MAVTLPHLRVSVPNSLPGTLSYPVPSEVMAHSSFFPNCSWIPSSLGSSSLMSADISIYLPLITLLRLSRCAPWAGSTQQQNTGDTDIAGGNPHVRNPALARSEELSLVVPAPNSPPSHLSPSQLSKDYKSLAFPCGYLIHDPLLYPTGLFCVQSASRNRRRSQPAVRPFSPGIGRRFNSPLASPVQNLPFSFFCPLGLTDLDLMAIFLPQPLRVLLQQAPPCLA